MYDKTPFFYGTGRRKSSVARVRLYKGTGKVVINNREIDDYFGLDTLKVIVRQPLELTGLTDRFDVICNVTGGGVTGQAGAIRHGMRPQNEGKKEVRSQKGKTCSPVLQEIKSIPRKRLKYAVFRLFKLNLPFICRLLAKKCGCFRIFHAGAATIFIMLAFIHTGGKISLGIVSHYEKERR